MHRVKAALVVLVGLVLSAGMVTAGVWQFRVYQRQGAEAAAARAAEPPVPLSSVARSGAPVSGGYGRTVTIRGFYEPEHQVLAPVAGQPDTFRVVTLFRLENGEAVAVVRGLSDQEPAAPPEPAGPVTQSGILLPSEEAAAPTAGAEIGSIRIVQLAQLWPGPLVDGFVVLNQESARTQQLTPAEVALPDARGRLRNAAYALQWWLFAAFTMVMSVRIARDIGRPTVAAGLRPDVG